MTASTTTNSFRNKASNWIEHLSIQQKTWIISLGAFGIFAIGLILGIQGTFSRSFRELELHSVHDASERLQHGLEQTAAGLEKMVRDYATWDDTYDFVVHRTQAYWDSNLHTTVFSNLDLNGLLIFDLKGNLVAGRFLKREGPLQEADSQIWSAPFLPLLGKVTANETGSARGLIKTPLGIALFACLPIIKTDASGPPRGAFVMLRLLDEKFLKNLRSLTVLDIAMHDFDASRADAPDRELASHRGSLPLTVLDDARLTLHLLMRDTTDKPAMVFSVSMERDIHRQGRNTTRISFFAILLVGGFSALVMAWLVRAQVIRPLETLHAAVNRIGMGGDPSMRLDSKGVDEIACLGKEINHMLDALARAEVQEARAKQESEHLQAQLMQAQKMEAIGTLAGGLAHDFNNMLNSILGSADLLRYELPQSHAGQEHIKRIEKAGNNASVLVRQLLTVSRRQVLKIEPVHLTELVNDVMRLLRAGLPKNIEFLVEPMTEDDLVMADPAQLHQVLINLATNSAHAMAGREHGRFRVMLELIHLPSTSRPESSKLNPGPYVRMTISDNGCGVPKENLEHIFEPFFTTKPLGSGSGLGLAVVHGIIIKHNGCIGIQSEPGQGTSFIIHLPLAPAGTEAKSAPAEIESVRAPTAPAASAVRKRCVLLVDDDRLVRDTLGAGLKRLGYVVLSTGNADEALRLVSDEKLHIDCLITDHMMPGTSGLELGRLIRERNPSLPMILISGYAEVLDESMVTEKGFNVTLTKPLTPMQLDDAVKMLLKAQGKQT